MEVESEETTTNTAGGVCSARRCHILWGTAIVVAIVASVATTLGILLSPSRKTPKYNEDTLVSLGSYVLLQTVPHDPAAFTQGLELVPGNPLEYFESTGLYDHSSVRRVDLATGKVLQQHNLTSSYFAEGLTYFDGKLIQITWRDQTVFIYNATDFTVVEQRSSFNTSNGQGWGICYVEASHTFLVTDGTHYLHTWDASTLELIDKVPVIMRGQNPTTNYIVARQVFNLNELEWDFHSATVLANIWQKDYIVRIDPSTGVVIAKYDLSTLDRPSDADVLNGITVTEIPNEIWVTGKLWPNMYLIRLVED